MATYLFTWNPDKWPWRTIAKDARLTARGKVFKDGWSCGNTKRIQVEDRAFLIKLGPKEPRGIVASGWVTSAPYWSGHWDPDLARQGKQALYAGIDFDRIIDPNENPDAIVPFSVLKNGTLAPVHWTTQRSGILIPEGAANELEHVWGKNLDKLDEVQRRGETDEDIAALEGEMRTALVCHRRREWRFRVAKLKDALRKGKGWLKCEVPRCKFDFFEVYGRTGHEYAQVHHLKPLADRTAPSRTKLDDLAIVCANCHVMIHRGGKCRPLKGLIKN